MPSRRTRLLVGLLVVPLGLWGCGRSNPASSDLVIDPIQVESVEVLVQESDPPQASAHVRGVIGDGCSSLHSVGAGAHRQHGRPHDP